MEMLSSGMSGVVDDVQSTRQYVDMSANTQVTQTQVVHFHSTQIHSLVFQVVLAATTFSVCGRSARSNKNRVKSITK